ncbi:hypothetical protein LTR36_003900 [Oleoguttula mirabilis]|uniref:Uncharacterized protein n=1 Tax=Oleoguttula mirabilis TaxID=1507867 RepID=A0AAV9JIE4_9PEZI|nr:hypothetical protein LTR36_003900 [Oleoguttula mirabilis]
MKSFLTLTLLSTAIEVSARKNNATPQPQLQHASHIFNAIHSSMRQFGSSLNHNGMSVFLATVPEDTEFYHGTSSKYRVNGTEWLAFEPEHALQFARAHGPGGGHGRGPPPSGGPPHEDGDGIPRSMRDDEEAEHLPPPPPPPHGERNKDLRRDEKAQHPIDIMAGSKPDLAAKPSPVDGSEPEHGYLHTYRTKHPLRLLYVDGQSAAKSQKGTLDVQDLVLLHHNPPVTEDGMSSQSSSGEQRPDGFEEADPPGRRGRERQRHDDGERGHRDDGEHRRPDFHERAERGPAYKRPSPAREDKEPSPPHHGPLGEGERAELMCRMAHEEYDDRIDGILRMEGGFEIILCNFEKDLDVVQIAQTHDSGSRDGPGMGPPGGRDGREGFNTQLAVSARYDGIGGNRVTLDYENFVTLFAYGDALYFDETGRPRVINETAAIDPVRQAIRHLAVSPNNAAPGKDWQAVADMIVTRYAERIGYLASGELDDLASFKSEVDRAMRPFIDYSRRNSTREIGRCASQFLPTKTSPSESLAEASLRDVTTVLCRTLSAASEVDTLSHGVSMVRALKSWLAWTTWKRCHCGEHEICFLAIWPQGSAEDFEQPQCKSAGDISQGRGGYWGGFGRPHWSDKRPHVDGY